MKAKSTAKPSLHFSWEEVERSDWAERNGVDNTLPEELEEAAIYTADKMEVVRSILRAPIHVNSWYRNSTVNKGVGSKVPTSQHVFAEAVDFVAPSLGSPLEICKLLSKHADLLDFNQLIYEFSWVHIAWYNPSRKQTNRREVLTIQPNGKRFNGLP